VDTVRIELLSLRPVSDRGPDPGPRWFDAAIQFAIDGVSWPLRLAFDVSFVSAWPCSDGPHPLFFDYAFEVVKADEVIDIRDWGSSGADSPRSGHHNRNGATPSPGAGGSKQRQQQPPVMRDGDDEKVLVVEAFGVPDNEVLVRAWCANWGLAAVVADIRKTCMACAIREAYAATITVVILVEDQEMSDE